MRPQNKKMFIELYQIKRFPTVKNQENRELIERNPKYALSSFSFLIQSQLLFESNLLKILITN